MNQIEPITGEKVVYIYGKAYHHRHIPKFRKRGLKNVK